jgi:hypothetical protein
MPEYGFIIFEDQSGNEIEREEGYDSLRVARDAAENRCGYWEEELPRGAYSYVIYDDEGNEYE